MKNTVAESAAEAALAFVESANYASLNSFYRMGFRDFARIRVARVFGWPVLLHGDRCARFRFRVAENVNQRLAGQDGDSAASSDGSGINPTPSPPPPADRKTYSASRSGEYR